MKENSEKIFMRKFTTGIVVFIILCVCLCITTLALVYATITAENNVFETGFVSINLNDGEAVINDSEFFFEPGMNIKKDFFIQNDSSRPVYYRLYLNDLQGGLASVIRVTVVDKTDPENVKVLYDNLKAEDMRRFNVETVKAPLEAGERRELEITFSLGEDEDNNYLDSGISFDLCAEAVQADSNSNMEFNETAPVTEESDSTGSEGTEESDVSESVDTETPGSEEASGATT